MHGRVVKPVLIILLSSLTFLPVHSQSGEELYNSVCAACHTINQGRLIGPDLRDIYNKRDLPWLISFIRSSQQMIKSNDPDAVAIYNEYNKIPMPDNKLTDQQIISIVDYIKSVDALSAQTTGETTDSISTDGDSLRNISVSAPAVADTISTNEDMVRKGRDYFYGNIPFSGNISSCVSCHNINDGTLFGGGRLALDLTGAYTKLGAAGITAILKNPPFPAMKLAMKGTLTDEELASLNSLFKSTSLRSSNKESLGGISFIVSGFLGALFMAVFLFLFYDERKIPRATIKN